MMARESAGKLRRLSLAISLAAALGTDAATHDALATTWPVGRCSDTVGKGGDTLRIAISHAANNDIVDLSTLPATCTGFTLTGGEIPINVGTLSIVSPRNITINGNANGRIFNHTPAGGILYLRYLTLTNGSVASGSGGCVISGGKLTLSHTTITGCQASQDGGGAYAASCNIIYSAVDSNLALRNAGGLFCNSGVATFVHSSVSGNLVGGGVFAPGSVAAYNSTFSNNGRDSGGGGAIQTFGLVKLVDSTVSGNTSAGSGGGVDTVGWVIAQNSILSGNSAGADGGAIHANYVTLTDSTVDGNYAKDYGGGLFSSGLSSTRSTLSANTAGARGGGAYAESGGTITNSTISGNHAAAGGGLAACCVVHAYNSTVVFNTASGDAAAATGGLLAGTFTMASSIVAKNSRASAGAADVYVTGVDDFLPTNSLIMSCNRTTLSITSDPRLTPLSLHGGTVPTHALSLGSPAIDAGNANGLSTDERGIGFSRSVGAAADIGAFERQVGEDELFYSGFD